MKQEVSIMHGKLAGKQSFIAMTLEADISLCNVKMSTHEELGTPPLLVKPPFSPPLKCTIEDVEFDVGVDREVTFNHCVRHGVTCMNPPPH